MQKGVVVSDRGEGKRSRRRVQFFVVGESMTKQAEMPACDINKIMAKYQKSGIIEHRNQFEGSYDDVTGAVDFQEALNIVQRSEDMFMTLPSSVRQKFENDPGKFLEFAQNPENGKAMVEMGLAVARPVSPVAEPPPPAPPPAVEETAKK